MERTWPMYLSVWCRHDMKSTYAYGPFLKGTHRSSVVNSLNKDLVMRGVDVFTFRMKMSRVVGDLRRVNAHVTSSSWYVTLVRLEKIDLVTALRHWQRTIWQFEFGSNYSVLVKGFSSYRDLDGTISLNQMTAILIYGKYNHYNPPNIVTKPRSRVGTYKDSL